MTANELRDKFNKEFGLNEWPKKYEVDADTYANICNFIISEYLKDKLQVIINMQGYIPGKDIVVAMILIGPNKGIMFKNVELILELLPE
jgi:hypothetical protein